VKSKLIFEDFILACTGNSKDSDEVG
jgi:hypothetical protein